MRKSFESPCPMKMQPLSTSKRSFLYIVFNGVRVCREMCGSRSPSRVQVRMLEVRMLLTRTLNTRELGQVVDDCLTSMNVVVDER
jgi:hypothetical protein